MNAPMTTPIDDFIRAYCAADGVRLHMPGHKGRGPLGCEPADLTEIFGADSLYEAGGIIAESEANAAALFGTRRTFYSVGGSSQAVKAMCLLACRSAVHSAVRGGVRPAGNRPVLAAGRNAHKSFVQAAQLIGFDIRWIPSEDPDYSLCRCRITPDGLTAFLRNGGPAPDAVYVTSPDYLGNRPDIRGLAEAAHAFGIPLLVDNAHGAYLRFLPEDEHPLSLGADASADSAHKTLPVLTGGSYLHIGMQAPSGFEDTARDALCLFGSTSPSYLILQSLDCCNRYLSGPARAEFRRCAQQVTELRHHAEQIGFTCCGDEPLKLTLTGTAENRTADSTVEGTAASVSGSTAGSAPSAFSGPEAAAFLRTRGIECEYADPDYLVMMWSPSNREEDYTRTREALDELAERYSAAASESAAVLCSSAAQGTVPSARKPLPFSCPDVVLQPREVLLLPEELCPVLKAEGRIAAEVSVGCPPAVLPVIAGERISREAVSILQYYGIREIRVLK